MKRMSQRLNRLTIGASQPASPPQGIRFARGMASSLQPSNVVCTPAFPRVFELTNRVNYDAVCPPPLGFRRSDFLLKEGISEHRSRNKKKGEKI